MKTSQRANQPPMVSIVIPVFNKCNLTVQCLETLARTPCRVPHEIIVVDNASTDATPERMRNRATNVRYIRNEANRNFAGACNQGAAAATGRYVLFLNNDTIPMAGWLEAMVDEVRSHPEVAAVGSRLLYENGFVQHAGVAFARESRNPFHPHRQLRADDPRVNHRRELQAVTAACVLFRPKWFTACGGFKEDYCNGYEDLDLCLNIRKRGGIIVYQPKSVVIHLESQSPGRMKHDNANRALFFKRWNGALLSDEDAIYFRDGYRIVGRRNRRPEQPQLARLATEEERRQWSVVAQTQELAAAWRRDEVIKLLANISAWPQDVAVRRWAGSLSQRFHLAEAAQRHFSAALELEHDAGLSAQLGRPAADSGSCPTAPWTPAWNEAFSAFRGGNFDAARNHFEMALLKGASPNLVLPRLWEATAQTGAPEETDTVRRALLSLPRLAPGLRDKSQSNRSTTVKQPMSKDRPIAVSTPAPTPARLASIIILAFNQLEHTRKCVASMLAHTHSPFEVIFVDNASTDGTAEYLAGMCRQHSNCNVITNRKNLGFAAGNNQGLAVAKGDVLVLLNNDTIVTPDWLEGVTAALQAEGSVGLAGPVSNRVSGPQLIPADYANDDAMFEFAKSWAAQNAGRTQPVARLVGFCLAFKRAVLDAIGGLDEGFGSGNFEDDDYCLRARFAGFDSRIARGVFIHHAGSQTFKGAQINYRQAMLRNWDLFRTKWQLPADVSLEKGYPIPTSKPETVSLHIALPSLGLTHKTDGRIFQEEEVSVKTKKKAEVPSVARLGNLVKARSLFGQRQFESAGKEVMAALNVRPFHPEAFLLLGEIALAAGDANSARKCAQHARDLVPGWNAPKQFLKKAQNSKQRAENNALLSSIVADVSRFTQHASRLSVCLIVKNEEKFLSQCLKSVRGLASQIVVVDTGSTDRTVEIAKEHGAEIYHITWNDDFSAARNAALEHATGDWVLMLDADEELLADQHANLRNDMKQADAVAFRLPLVNRGEEGQGHCYVPRLFRNLPGAYYYGRIHEQVFPSLIAASKGWGLATRFGTARILHHGYAGEVVKDRSKVERNLSLLRQAVTEYPDDANLIMNLGLELVHSGDLTTGLKHYRDAFRLMSAQLPGGVVPELREVLLTQLTCHLYQVRAHDEIVQTLNTPLAKHGGLTASLHFALALAHFELKQFQETAEHMRQCLAKRGEPTFAPLNSDILTAAPHHCLAVALTRLGNNTEAEKSFQAGLKEKGRIEELRLDYAKFLTDQGRPVEALHQLHEIVQPQPQHAVAWRFGGEIALSKTEFLEFARDWTSEAIRHLPDDGVIVAQRAEVLLLSQDTTAALPLWTRAINGKRPPHALAAQIICATAGSQPIDGLQDHAEETAVSHAFVNWYRRLVSAGARDTIFHLNSQVETLRPVLPSAATVLDGVIASMRKNNVAETVCSLPAKFLSVIQ